MHIILFAGLFAILCLGALGQNVFSGSRPITGHFVKILRIWSIGQFFTGRRMTNCLFFFFSFWTRFDFSLIVFRACLALTFLFLQCFDCSVRVAVCHFLSPRSFRGLIFVRDSSFFSSDRFWLSLRFIIIITVHPVCIGCGVAHDCFMLLARHVLSTQTEKYRCTFVLFYLLHAFNLLIVVGGSTETARHPVTVKEIICTVALVSFSSQCQVHWSVYDCQSGGWKITLLKISLEFCSSP